MFAHVHIFLRWPDESEGMGPKYTLLTQSIDFTNILNECRKHNQSCELHLAAKNSSVPEPDVSTVMFMNAQNYIFIFVSVPV